jgi:plastocyanin
MRTIIIRTNHQETAMRILCFITLLFPLVAHAADNNYKLVINDHRFQPAELTIPSGTKIKLTVENQDATPEEFDSFSLNREKVIAGHSTVTIYIGPLTPGRYPFTGEFHETTAQGVIVAQ